MTERKPIKSDKKYNPKPRKNLGKGTTPQETIDELNNKYQDWKGVEQIQYDNNGMRIK